MINIIKPAWPAPTNVIAGVTTRTGGVSSKPYDQLNMATHVGDQCTQVDKNRQILDQHCRQNLNIKTKLTWHWLEQTHSTDLLELNSDISENRLHADASYTSHKNQVCVVMTADCLPVLLTDRSGSFVAAIHAGWRGLCNGIIQSTVKKLCQKKPGSPLQAKQFIAWLGPAIGPQSFEVGDDVRQAFLTCSLTTAHSKGTIDSSFTPAEQWKYLCDLYHLATLALQGSGVKQIYGGGFDTYEQSDSFYSYRRDGVTGRMASFIFINADSSQAVS